MKDPELRAATASEPLTLEEEYAMQDSWRTDTDKLTFIACMSDPLTQSPKTHLRVGEDDAPHNMIGDINLFLTPDSEEDDDEEKQAIVGEIEIMIASKAHQGQGLGREILLMFIWYILRSYSDIVSEYHRNNRNGRSSYIRYLRVKIDHNNLRSVKLFENVGFQKVSDEPNYFGEVELRWEIYPDSMDAVQGRMDTVPRISVYQP